MALNMKVNVFFSLNIQNLIITKKFKNKISYIFVIGKIKTTSMTPIRHPGFLSFGSVDSYTLISPSSPYVSLDLSLGLADRSRLFPLKENILTSQY